MNIKDNHLEDSDQQAHENMKDASEHSIADLLKSADFFSSHGTPIISQISHRQQSQLISKLPQSESASWFVRLMDKVFLPQK